ncbi:Uncharacterised protein [Mycobacteroides abscessus subsp. abscessus]|nr:Uncharacterised protein [Mycobacteroides abscessus subsp. abscessus]
MLSAPARGNRSWCSGRTRSAWPCTAVGKNKNLESANAKRFSWIPPLRSRIVCLPSSKACTAALHSFSAVVTQPDYVRGATSTGQLALCINA